MTGWNSDWALISRVMRLLPGLHGRPGQAAGHQGGHGPQDHGFTAGGEASVIAGGAAVPADPGEPPLCDPAAGQDLEGVRVAPGGDLDRHRHGGGPGGELAVQTASARIRRMRPRARWRFRSSGRAASRSGADAAVITTAACRPVASTAMCRFLPFAFFALSQPRLPRAPCRRRAAHRAAGPGCHHRARPRSTRTPSAGAGNRLAGTARRTRSGPRAIPPRRSGAAARPAACPAAPGPQLAAAAR
jgi:hypothetical protein